VTATRTLNYTSRRRSSWAGDAAGSPLLENKAHRGPLFGKLCRFSLSDAHERSSKASQRKNLHRGGALSFTSRGGRVLLICGPLPNEAVRLIGQLKLLHPRPKGDVLHNRRDGHREPEMSRTQRAFWSASATVRDLRTRGDTAATTRGAVASTITPSSHRSAQNRALAPSPTSTQASP
jgi:hypothetical protein